MQGSTVFKNINTQELWQAGLQVDLNTHSSLSSGTKTVQHFHANPASYAGYPWWGLQKCANSPPTQIPFSSNLVI